MPIRRGNAPHYTWGERCDGWHLVRRAELSVIAEEMPPGSAEVEHHHAVARQFFYICGGEAVMKVGVRKAMVLVSLMVASPACAMSPRHA